MVCFVLYPLADQFVKGKALASKGRSRFHKPISIGSLASIKPKRLLVQVSKQVERFDRNIRTFDRPLEQRPKVFNSVSVNDTIYVLFGMVDDSVKIITFKPSIRLKHVL